MVGFEIVDEEVVDDGAALLEVEVVEVVVAVFGIAEATLGAVAEVLEVTVELLVAMVRALNVFEADKDGFTVLALGPLDVTDLIGLELAVDVAYPDKSLGYLDKYWIVDRETVYFEDFKIGSDMINIFSMASKTYLKLGYSTCWNQKFIKLDEFESE